MRKEALLTVVFLLASGLLASGVFAAGEFTQLWGEQGVIAGDYTKITAVFENTGNIPLAVCFKGSAYKEDELIETLESEKVEVPAGSTVELPVYFKAELPGLYVIRGNIAYGTGTTRTLGILLDVSLSGNWKEEVTPLSVGITALVVIAICLVFMIAVARGMKRRK